MLNHILAYLDFFCKTCRGKKYAFFRSRFAGERRIHVSEKAVKRDIRSAGSGCRNAFLREAVVLGMEIPGE